MAKLAALLLTNLELVLAAMSIPVILAVHLLISRHFEDPWKITAAVAVTVGVLHGFLGWMVRSRQRSVRGEVLRRLGAILQRISSGNTVSAADAEAIADATPAPSTEYDIRLALVQLVALVREPLVVNSVSLSGPVDLQSAAKMGQ
jgi:hypothetical protein